MSSNPIRLGVANIQLPITTEKESLKVQPGVSEIYAAEQEVKEIKADPAQPVVKGFTNKFKASVKTFVKRLLGKTTTPYKIAGIINLVPVKQYKHHYAEASKFLDPTFLNRLGLQLVYNEAVAAGYIDSDLKGFMF